MNDYVRAWAFALALAPFVTSTAAAQVVRSPRPAVVPSPAHAVPGVRAAARLPANLLHPKRLHIAYGSIESIGKTTLVLLVRGHREINVDMTAALADGTFSNPLTIGNFFAVEGEYGADRVLYASNITRMTRLDDSTGPDR